MKTKILTFKETYRCHSINIHSNSIPQMHSTIPVSTYVCASHTYTTTNTFRYTYTRTNNYIYMRKCTCIQTYMCFDTYIFKNRDICTYTWLCISTINMCTVAFSNTNTDRDTQTFTLTQQSAGTHKKNNDTHTYNFAKIQTNTGWSASSPPLGPPQNLEFRKMSPRK